VTETKPRADEALSVAVGMAVTVTAVAGVGVAEGFVVSVFGDECDEHATRDVATTAIRTTATRRRTRRRAAAIAA
jgi:hypothetical protein